MAAATMDREPQDFANYVDTYKHGQQVEDKRSKFGGGTSLPLDSDGYEDRQRNLKTELRKDFLEQQDRHPDHMPQRGPIGISNGPQNGADYDEEIHRMTDRYHKQYNNILFDADKPNKPVYYRVGTPEEGFPGLGQYQQQREQMNVVRNKEYNERMKKQKQMEQQRLEARKRSPPRQVQPHGQLDYNQQQEQARVEDKRAYQDYMGKYQHPISNQVKPIINYEENRKTLAEERRREYAQYREKREKEERYWAMRGRPVTPPGGLDIGHYDRQQKEDAPKKKKEYKEMLDHQKDQRLKFRAWERTVELAPNYMRYRDEERPLVGSPRDVNFPMREKENKDRLKRETKLSTGARSPASNSRVKAVPIEDDPDLNTYLQLEAEKVESKRTYRDELLKQQKEHMYLRARQEPEVAVIDRKPPPGPGRSSRQTPHYWNEGRRAKSPQSLDSVVSKSSQPPSKSSRPNTNSDIPLAFRTEPHSHPPPNRQSHGQPPFYGEGQGQPGPDPQQTPPAFARRRSPERYDDRRRFNDRDDDRGRFDDRGGYDDRRFNDLSNFDERGRDGDRARFDERRRDGPNGYLPSKPDEDQRRQAPPRSPLKSPQKSRRSPVMNGEQQYQSDRSPRRRSPPPPTPPRSPEKRLALSPGRSPRTVVPPVNSLPIDDSGIETARRQANLMVRNDYNEHVKVKNEEQRLREESRRVPGKPAEIVKTPHYSSDDYESFRQQTRRKQEEEYREFLKQQFEPPPGRVGLPLGQYKYEPKRLAMEAERNQEYNMAQEQYQPSTEAPGLPLGQYKYEPKRLAMEAERNQEYNNMLKKNVKQAWGDGKTSPTRNKSKATDGPQGLNIDITYPHRKQAWLEQQRNKEYNDFLKKNMRPSYGPVRPPPEFDLSDRKPEAPPLPPKPVSAPLPSSSGPPTPSNLSLPVGTYDEMRPYMVKQRNKEYNEFKQKIQQQPKGKQMDVGEKEGGAVLPVGTYDLMRPLLEGERNREYNKFLDTLPPVSDRRGMTPKATATSLPVGQYEKVKPLLEHERNVEYNSLRDKGDLEKRSLRAKAPTPPSLQGLSIGQHHYEPMYKAMSQQRNKEYNDFLQKKYGGDHHNDQKSYRSLPERTSYFVGNDQEHVERRRQLDGQRHQEYNQMLREKGPPRARNMEVPTDAESGLPIGQQHHSAWKSFLSQQRNMEYNQMMDKKSGQEHRNRGWNYDQNGILPLHGEDDVQTRQRELRAERRQEYNTMISQMKGPPNRNWPAPTDRGALLVKKGVYDGVREMYAEQRKKDFVEQLGRNRQLVDVRPRVQSEPPRPRPAVEEYVNPMVQAMGTYDDYRRKLILDRRSEFQRFLQKKRIEECPRLHHARTPPRRAVDEIPLVDHMGQLETERKQRIRAEERSDLEKFRQRQDQQWTPRSNVRENMMPHVASAETPLVNHMGIYDQEKSKIRQQQQQDMRAFIQKKKLKERSPYENYVYPTVAVAEKPIVDYLGQGLDKHKEELRTERRSDYERYMLEQKTKEGARRHDYIDSASGPYDGLFNGFGEHNNREHMNNQRRKDYHEQTAGQEVPSGRPNWVRDTLPNNTDRGRSPMRNPPPGPGNQYQQMLDEKRREEQHRRRFDDPEYQGRLADGRHH